jgi:hypothetical protein
MRAILVVEVNFKSSAAGEAGSGPREDAMIDAHD